jgi:hypothetical protein
VKKFIIILIIYPYFLFSQNDSLTKQFVNDFVKEKLKLGFDEVKLGNADNFFTEIFSRSFGNKRNHITFKNREQKDSISLSKKEAEFITSELNKSENPNWNIDDFSNDVITKKDIQSYLNKEKNNIYFAFLKPIFMRDNEFMLIRYVYLRWGSSAGTFLGFYKKINGTWKEWIPISEGVF